MIFQTHMILEKRLQLEVICSSVFWFTTNLHPSVTHTEITPVITTYAILENTHMQFSLQNNLTAWCFCIVNYNAAISWPQMQPADIHVCLLIYLIMLWPQKEPLQSGCHMSTTVFAYLWICAYMHASMYVCLRMCICMSTTVYKVSQGGCVKSTHSNNLKSKNSFLGPKN